MDRGNGRLTAISRVATAVANPTYLVPHPSGGYLYVSHNGGTRISVFQIDAKIGTLSLVTDFASQTAGPGRMAVSPDGRFLYVSNDTPPGISIYAIDGGSAVPALQSTYTTGLTENRDIAMTADGKTVFASNVSAVDLSAFARDASTGALTHLNTLAFGGGSDPDGSYVDATGTTVITRMSGGGGIGLMKFGADGSLTSASVDAALNPWKDLAVGSRNILYHVENGTPAVTPLYLDAAAATLTTVGTAVATADTTPETAQLSPDESFLVVGCSGAITAEVFDLAEPGLIRSRGQTSIGSAGAMTDMVVVRVAD